LRTMGARHAVLLTPPKTAHPDQLLSCKQGVPLSPLFAALTDNPQLSENKATLSPFLATHTDVPPVSPVFATHTKTTGVHTNSSHFGACRVQPRGIRYCSSRFLCALGVSALHPILSLSTLNLQLLTSFLSLGLSFHSLTNCPFSIPFVLTSMHRMGGVWGVRLPAFRGVVHPPTSRSKEIPH